MFEEHVKLIMTQDKTDRNTAKFRAWNEGEEGYARRKG